MKTISQVLAFFALFLIKQGLGSPIGAPVCPLSQPAPDGAFPSGHLDPNRPITMGTLAEAGIVVSIDGCILEEGVPYELKVFEAVTVTISRSSMFFRGVLARFNVDQAIGLMDGDADLQVAEKCTEADVSCRTNVKKD